MVRVLQNALNVMEKGESEEVFLVPQQSANIVMVLELRSAVFVMVKAIVSFQLMVKKYGRENVNKSMTI